VTHQRYLHTGSGTNDFSGIIDFRALPSSSPQSAAGKATIMVTPPPFSKRLERLQRFGSGESPTHAPQRAAGPLTLFCRYSSVNQCHFYIEPKAYADAINPTI
jgi:hypothetical protein